MAFAEIFRSVRLIDCEQRAFILGAVGIEHVIHAYDDLFGLFVPEELAATATGHLASYEAEIRVPSLPPVSPPLHARAWIGSIVSVAVLVVIAYCAGENIGGLRWFENGVLNHAVTGAGQWWRVVTALTLHADLGHLLGNIAFGAPFSFFAAQLLGSGRAWISILVAAAAANLLDSMVMPTGQFTIGASTAVFAMLGLVAAYAWRRNSGGATRWAHRWAPLIAGIALLGITGAGGEHTDVLAHLAGFGTGVVLGVAHAHLPMRVFDSPLVQRVTAALSLAAVVGAWAWALTDIAH